MRVSARNVLPAIVKRVTPGAVDSEVVSIISEVSAEKIALQPDAKVYAMIKAPNVMIGVD